MTIEVRVGGAILSGFLRGAVQLSMESPANSFDVEYLAHPSEPDARLMFAGDAVDVLLDGENILSGYVDTTDEEDSPDEVRLRASGRSRTADLVDCSASYEGFANARVSEIAQRLAAPHDVLVRVEGDEGERFPHYRVQPGDTVMDAITRAAQKRGLFPYAVGGDLVLGRAGAVETETKLVRGQLPLIRTARSDSWYSRYSEYVFRGQVKASEAAWGKRASQVKHRVTDEAITRYRPLLLHAEAGSAADLEARATLERNQRAGRGERIQASVFGYQTAEGYAWRPNMQVNVQNVALGIDAWLLVVAVRYRFGAEEPREVELELARPESFELKRYPPLKRGRKRRATSEF